MVDIIILYSFARTLLCHHIAQVFDWCKLTIDRSTSFDGENIERASLTAYINLYFTISYTLTVAKVKLNSPQLLYLVVDTFEASIKCFLHLRYSLFKITCKIVSSCNKATRHIISCVVNNYKFTFLAAHVRDKDCTNYQCTPLISNVALNIQRLGTFKVLFESNTFVYALLPRFNIFK